MGTMTISRMKTGHLTRAEAYADLEDNYLPSLQADGRKLPASVDRPHTVSMHLVSGESGVPHDFLNREGEECRRLILDNVPVLGIEVRLPPRKNQLHTLKDWKDIVIVRRRAACEREGRDHEEECAGFEATFALVAALFGGKVSVPARAALAKAIQAPHETSSDLYKPHVKRQLEIAEKYLDEAEKGIGAPDTLHGRLRFELALVGMSPWSLARVIGLPPQTVLDFAEARKTPGSAMAVPLRHAEEFLRRPAGTFVALIADGSAVRGKILSKHLPPGTRYERERLKQRLPEDFSRQPPEQREPLLNDALLQIEKWQLTPEAKRAELRANRYALTKWPKRLEQEWQTIVAARRPQRLPLGTTAQKTGWKSEHTIRLWRNRYAEFFGFLVNRLHELAKVPGYEDRGPFTCLRPDQLSFALLTQDTLSAAFMCWLVWRKQTVGLPELHTHTGMEFEHERLRLTRKLPTRRWGATA